MLGIHSSGPQRVSVSVLVCTGGPGAGHILASGCLAWIPGGHRGQWCINYKPSIMHLLRVAGEAISWP